MMEPSEVLLTIEMAAKAAREEDTPWNVSARFVDDYDTVVRAENGN